VRLTSDLGPVRGNTRRSQNIFLEHANLIKKLSFPRMTLPVIVVLGPPQLRDHLQSLPRVPASYRQLPGLAILAMIPLLAVQTAFSIGLGVTLGVLIRVLSGRWPILRIFLQFWFWLTPIVYPPTVLP